MDQILKPKDLDFLTVYVDDILIASRTFEDHLDHLGYVLAKLKEGGLTVNWDKSKFLQTQINFLGFIITPEGISANPDKVDSIMRFPEPKNIKQLVFLDCAIFIENFRRTTHM